MDIKKIISNFVLYFIIIFVVSALVSFVYSLIAHGSGIFDWETSFRLAITFGILFSWMNARETKK